MNNILKTCAFCKKENNCLDRDKAIKLEKIFEKEYPNFSFKCDEYDSILSNGPKYKYPKIK